MDREIWNDRWQSSVLATPLVRSHSVNSWLTLLCDERFLQPGIHVSGLAEAIRLSSIRLWSKVETRS